LVLDIVARHNFTSPLAIAKEPGLACYLTGTGIFLLMLVVFNIKSAFAGDWRA